MIIPLNDNILVKPVQKDSIIATQDSNYDEKGICLMEVKTPTGEVVLSPNQIVYFDSWQAAKYTDSAHEEFWLIPASAIRAKEQNEQVAT